MFRCILVAIEFCAATAELAAQGKLGDRQFYTEWRRQKNSKQQYLKLYYFKVNPNDESYHVQFVVWVPQQPKLAFYYNANGQYWCAAPADKVDRWHILETKTAKISDVVLPELQKPPPIPLTKGTDNEAPMLFPSFAGLPNSS